MANIWDDLKKNMKNWSSSAVEKAEEVSKKAVSKTEELTKIGKIKLELHQLNKDLGRVYEEVGKFTYTYFQDKKTLKVAGNQDLADYWKEIESLKQKIHDKDVILQQTKDTVATEEAEKIS